MKDKLIVLWNLIKVKCFLRIPCGEGLRLRGHIGLEISRKSIAHGRVTFGKRLQISSGNMSNPMGRNVKTYLRVDDMASLHIGDNVGMSSATLWCSDSVVIGDNVKIGAMTIVTDTDAHSLNPVLRADEKTDAMNAAHAPIVIKRNAFVGAMCFVGKGVTIGENSILGAGSVLTKSIPDNEVWAGNPATFVRHL